MLLGIIKKKKEFAGAIAPVTVLFYWMIILLKGYLKDSRHIPWLFH